MKNPGNDTVWFDRGATMSDKSAREEFGLTEAEIIKAVRGRKLRHRVICNRHRPEPDMCIVYRAIPQQTATAKRHEPTSLAGNSTALPPRTRHFRNSAA